MNKRTKIVAFDVGAERPTEEYVAQLEAENEALKKIKRAAKLYLEHGEPELADELDALLTND